MHVLVDADILAVRVAASCEHKVTADEAAFDGREAGEVDILPIEAAYHRMENLVIQISQATGLDDPKEVAYFLRSVNGNFRKDIYPDYKANRTTPKPQYTVPLEEYLIQNYGAMRADHQEADDDLGIAATTCWEAGERAVIVTIDKDLKQIPGSHYNFLKDEWDEVDEHEGDFQFYTQLLMGDSVDNIKGCPKIGVKTAEKLLRPYFGDALNMQEVAFNTYQKAYPQQCADEVREIIVLVGRLVYIRKHVGELWTPM